MELHSADWVIWCTGAIHNPDVRVLDASIYMQVAAAAHIAAICQTTAPYTALYNTFRINPTSTGFTWLRAAALKACPRTVGLLRN
jgi:hypothetical protein